MASRMAVRGSSPAPRFSTRRYIYTAFGQKYGEIGVEAVPQRYTFTGRESAGPAAAAAGAPMYYRYRMYSPSLGRFGRRDPEIGGDDLFNAYGFPGEAPSAKVDPFGAWAFDVAGKAAIALKDDTWWGLARLLTGDGKRHAEFGGGPLAIDARVPLDKWLARNDCRLILALYPQGKPTVTLESLVKEVESVGGGDRTRDLWYAKCKSVRRVWRATLCCVGQCPSDPNFMPIDHGRFVRTTGLPVVEGSTWPTFEVLPIPVRMPPESDPRKVKRAQTIAKWVSRPENDVEFALNYTLENVETVLLAEYEKRKGGIITVLGKMVCEGKPEEEILRTWDTENIRALQPLFTHMGALELLYALQRADARNIEKTLNKEAPNLLPYPGAPRPIPGS